MDLPDISAPKVSAVAALFSDATRAGMLLHLLSGQAHTAGELARALNVSPQTASNHLAQLLTGGLVEVAAQGRHRYYRLSGPDVAQVLEAFTALEERPTQPLQTRVPPELRFARRCYDHLAGELGVQLLDVLLERHYVISGRDAWQLSPSGEAWFTALGVDIPALRRRKQPMLRPCMDWSERRPHLGGPLGKAFLTQLLALGWLARTDTRSLRLSVTGMLALERELDLKLRGQTAN